MRYSATALPSETSRTIAQMRADDGSNDVITPSVVGVVVLIGAGGAAAVASQSDKTAPILAFAGAILVALITWYATDRRQAAALAAEQQRLDAQLRHERDLSERAELLTVLDETFAIINETSYDCLDLAPVVREREQTLAQISAVGDAETEQRKDALEHLRVSNQRLKERGDRLFERGLAHLRAAHLADSRLSARLGGDDRILAAFGPLSRALGALREAAEAGDDDAVTKALEGLETAHGTFIQAVNSRVGVKL
jgi:hypothetical protein